MKEIYQQVKKYLLMFFDRDITVYASSLSFYTIFTIVPLLIVSLSLIANVPALEEQNAVIQIFIFENIMPTQTEAIASYLDSFFQNSVKLGVIGFATAIASSILFFQNLEHIIEKVFNSPKRKIWNLITTYWTIITLSPIALIASMSIKSYIDRSVEGILPAALSIVPFLLTWGMFYLVYKIVINTELSVKSVTISSLFVTIVWSIAKSVFTQYVFYNKAYATMYGSFSSLIFFFLWIYVSWIIVIYGIKLCYLINRSDSTKESQSS